MQGGDLGRIPLRLAGLADGGVDLRPQRGVVAEVGDVPRAW
jgi:hypothetical protein